MGLTIGDPLVSYSTMDNDTLGDNFTSAEDINGTNLGARTVDELLLESLGERRHSLPSTIFLLTIYSLIFISGTVGNVCTCLVIARNNYMHTSTNYYLFSLAISDVLILLLALPSEAYTIWESYPWRFGEAFCYIKALMQETLSYASVLTITAFTMERYIAICHPLKAHTFTNLSRSVKIIVAIWVISVLCALPYPLHTDVFYFVHDVNGTPVAESLICNIALPYQERMTYIFQLSTFLFFVFPMTVISVLYLFIALALHKAALQRVASNESGHSSGPSIPGQQSRKVVLRMLVAVVVAFFISWAPFHAQRLMTIYNRVWTPVLHSIQSTLFYISGVLYFVGSTVNPILYNLMSRRYRDAFKETIWKCRRKRAALINGSSCHQVYFNKSLRGTRSSYYSYRRNEPQSEYYDASVSQAPPRSWRHDNGVQNGKDWRLEKQPYCSHVRNKFTYCKLCAEYASPLGNDSAELLPDTDNVDESKC